MLQLLVMVLVAGLIPVLGFGLLLWLSHLEDSLGRPGRRAGLRPVPTPIHAIPLQRTRSEAQTQAQPQPQPQPQPQGQVDAVSVESDARSAPDGLAPLSEGGSTNR